MKKEVKELLTRDLSGLRDRFFLWLANKLPGFEVLDIFARPPLLRLAGVQVYGWNMIYRPFSVKFPRQLRIIGGACINEGCRLDAEGGSNWGSMPGWGRNAPWRQSTTLRRPTGPKSFAP